MNGLLIAVTMLGIFLATFHGHAQEAQPVRTFALSSNQMHRLTSIFPDGESHSTQENLRRYLVNGGVVINREEGDDIYLDERNKQVSARLAIEPSPHEEREFEDGEHKARPLTSVRGKDVFVHISAVEKSGMSALDEGQKVSFELAPDREGRMTAVNLKSA